MEEHDWLTSDDFPAVFSLATENPDHQLVRCCRSDRKLRLLAAAACRKSLGTKVMSTRFWDAVCALEDHADGNPVNESLLWTYFHKEWDPVILADLACYKVPDAVSLVRDITGNVFRPVYRDDGAYPKSLDLILFETKWATPQVFDLARAAYEQRLPDYSLDPARLAVLSDALEEQGCPAEIQTLERCSYCQGQGFIRHSEKKGGPYEPRGPLYVIAPPRGDVSCYICQQSGRVVRIHPHPVLAHLRSPGPKYRGSWSLDTVLGKS